MISITHPVTLEQRREVLDDLVHRWEDMPEGARDRILQEVTVLRHEELRVAMKALAEAIHDADSLDAGVLHWSQYCPEVTGGACGGDRQHEALLIARSQVDDAMTVLLRDPVGVAA